MSRPTILIAGGGTGGHVFPAVAVAEAMQAQAEVDVVFCGTRGGVEEGVIPRHGWALEFLHVEPMKGAGTRHAMRAALVAASATVHAISLLRRRMPRAVLGVGGYASGPATLAAVLGGVPIALLEPNRVVGLANRLLAPMAARAYVASDEAAAHFRASARRPYGVPIRCAFAPSPYAARGTARVLVMGGSQGAAALNERMPAALARLKGDRPDLEVTHQAGRDREEGVRAAYSRAGLGQAAGLHRGGEATGSVSVVAFLDDVATAVANADLVVARAGAGTIAEITAIGRASVLVPFPHAADDHQRHNAEALARAGAAVCLEQAVADPSRIAAELRRLLVGDPARVAMADAARALGRPNAARDVAADLLALALDRPRGREVS